MDLQALNSSFQAVARIDSFISVIWTERYSDKGDITLVVPSNSPWRSYLTEGSFLSVNLSREVMMITSVNEKESKLTITGKSIVDVFSQRIFRDTWTTAKDTWVLPTGAVGTQVASIIQDMVMGNGVMAIGNVVPFYGPYEVITGLQLGNRVLDGAITSPAVPYGNLFDAIKTLCDGDGVGFRLYLLIARDDGTYNLNFDTYRGRDLTSSQSQYPAVIFDSAMDSLTAVEGLWSIEGYKTAVYVWASGIASQTTIGYAFVPGTENYKDFQRRTLMVEATDLNAADYTPSVLKSLLNKRAVNELVNNNYVRMTNGQIVPQSTYEYGIDYTLGDVIELRGSSSTAQKARITEYIRTQDSTGERAYPTLSVIS